MNDRRETIEFVLYRVSDPFARYIEQYLRRSSREQGDRNNQWDNGNDDDDGGSGGSGRRRYRQYLRDIDDIIDVNVDRHGRMKGLFEEASSNRRCRTLIAAERQCERRKEVKTGESSLTTASGIEDVDEGAFLCMSEYPRLDFIEIARRRYAVMVRTEKRFPSVRVVEYRSGVPVVLPANTYRVSQTAESKIRETTPLSHRDVKLRRGEKGGEKEEK